MLPLLTCTRITVYPGTPTYRRAFRIVESGTPWYVSMRLGELNRTIPGRPGLDNFERSYSSAVGWARDTGFYTIVTPLHNRGEMIEGYQNKLYQ